ncbi:MAG: methylated-DNA--[protein]-cysteine S-methyltransferase [Gemmiger sp.]|nr:methylated-DNA--[protein]-cysteine S-methyltransferase [Gemmiger sp.]
MPQLTLSTQRPALLCGVTCHPSPIGPLYLAADAVGLCGLSRTAIPGPVAAPGSPAEALLHRAATQLDEYFAGQRRTFTIPLSLHGTAFQCRVWQALFEIPYGQTRSYAAVAAAIGTPKGCRAVGMANHANPILLIIPCHRVIAAGGGLGGYGEGLPTKRWLLRREGVLLPE